jgi:thiamine pyrophosphokinase
LLLRPIIQEKQTRITLIDRNNFIYAVKSGVHSIPLLPEFRYVSFFPITPIVRNLSLKGFKYPLTDCHIPLGSTLCISNELINDSGTFSFDKGILMVIRSRDEKSP